MILPFLRFHAERLYRARPIVSMISAMSGIALAAAVAFSLEGRHAVQTAQADLARLQASISAKKPLTPPASLAGNPAMALPSFDNVELVQTLNSLAADANLPLDEVAYALDEGSSEPYLRYRINLAVAANYQAIRTFSDQFIGELPNVSLDAISCARRDVSTVPLTCDLAFSAFYRRSPRG
jgi:hypothetical protein